MAFEILRNFNHEDLAFFLSKPIKENNNFFILM